MKKLIYFILILILNFNLNVIAPYCLFALRPPHLAPKIETKVLKNDAQLLAKIEELIGGQAGKDLLLEIITDFKEFVSQFQQNKETKKEINGRLDNFISYAKSSIKVTNNIFPLLELILPAELINEFKFNKVTFEYSPFLTYSVIKLLRTIPLPNEAEKVIVSLEVSNDLFPGIKIDNWAMVIDYLHQGIIILNLADYNGQSAGSNMQFYTIKEYTSQKPKTIIIIDEKTAESINLEAIAELYNNLGEYHIQEKENWEKGLSLQAKSFRWLRKGLKSESVFNNNYFCIAKLYFDFGAVEGAREYYEELLKMNLPFWRLYSRVGDFYLESGDYKRAIECYQKAIEINPEDYKSYLNVYLSLIALGKYKEANEYYQKVLASTTNEIFQALLSEGEIYRDTNILGKIIKDIEIYQKKMKEETEKFENYYQLGLMYRTLANYDTALKYLEKATEKNPAYHPAYYEIGLIYEELHNYPQAVKYLQKALDLNLPLVRTDIKEKILLLQLKIYFLEKIQKENSLRQKKQEEVYGGGVFLLSVWKVLQSQIKNLFGEFGPIEMPDIFKKPAQTNETIFNSL